MLDGLDGIVNDDPVEPRPEGARRVVLLRSLEDPNESLAHHILSQWNGVCDQVRSAQCARLVSADQLTEGADIALFHPFHVLLVAHFSPPLVGTDASICSIPETAFRLRKCMDQTLPSEELRHSRRAD